MTTPQNELYRLSERIHNLRELFTNGDEDKNCLFSRIDDVENKINDTHQMINAMMWKLERLNESVESIVHLEKFMENLGILEMKMNDQKEKLIENTLRVNEMTLELKGVVSQARSCVNERKDFVRNLGAALAELS